jgi:hypothetical protein
MNLRPHQADFERAEATVSRRAVVFGALASALTITSPSAYAAAKKTTKKKKTTKAAATTVAGTPASTATGGFPGGKEVAVAFTYVSESGGRSRNPYIAVWIEDTQGAALRTLEISFEQGGKGRKYLRDLPRWYNADQVRQITGGVDVTTTVSSATRLPGSYSFVWDGRDDAKAQLPAGDYVVCIEAAREHGPYSLVKEPIAVATAAFKKTPADNNELQAVTIEFRNAK